MIDPILSLAISVQSNPGVYMLLLGSGISRTAGIPTGWEVVLNLVRRLAHLKGEDPEPDPEAWYRKTFGKEADYSGLLDAVAKSPAERQQLLRSYFEPSDEDREEGMKMPTSAHRAIASLVAKGYIRVVLTTNFDRLLEKALEDAGVTPSVIDTADKVGGAMPIVHSPCTVVKLHGDYLDTRILNTPRELETYSRKMNRLLDRVLDEFGLIVCGWSAEWDTALRAGIERCQSRRFTMYWAAFGDPPAVAHRLIDHRRGQIISIKGADWFFRELLEKVESLESIASSHPMAARVAAATTKRLVAEPKHRIRLHDLFVEETERVVSGMNSDALPGRASENVTLDQIKKFEALTEPLWTMLAAGCYWGEELHNGLWTQCIERLARAAGDSSYNRALRRYPALLSMYAAGIAAVAAENYGALRAALVRATYQDFQEEKPVVKLLYGERVIGQETGNEIFATGQNCDPVSQRVYDILRDCLRSVLPDEDRYTRTFDRYEYLMSMVYADQELGREFWNGWIPVGSFVWRDRDNRTGLAARIKVEIEIAGADWAPLQAGFFGGSSERALAVWDATERRAARVRDALGLI